MKTTTTTVNTPDEKFQAGFAKTDISPQKFPVRTYLSQADAVMDPLYARAAAFNDGHTTVVLVAFDIVILEAPYVQKLRKQFAAATGLPEGNLLVHATHNHACPAVVERPNNPPELEYLDGMLAQGLQAALDALRDLSPVEVCRGYTIETRVSCNRRFIKKDGTVITQPGSMAGILCNEGVIDPTLEVMACRHPNGAWKGALVNFACHAVHHMGKLSAGYPGILCDRLQEAYGAGFGCVFLNGACGNIIHRDYTNAERSDMLTKEYVGETLAADVRKILEQPEVLSAAPIRIGAETVHIKYRDITELERNIDNQAWFVNVFPLLLKLDWFRWSLARLKELQAKSDGEDAIVQVIRLGGLYLAGIPAEYFTEFGLRIKEQSPAPAWVISLANGWLGYIPTPQALARKGGHETTITTSSKMEPAAGDILADTALKIIRQLAG